MASISIVIFLVLSVLMFHGEALTHHYETKNCTELTSRISLGSSLYPPANSSWRSPSGYFEFGFYEQGRGFAIGIWLVGGPENDRSKTVVWTANRDDSPVTSNAKLEFTDQGKLLLRIEKGEDKLIANTTRSAFSASMLDSGNFVLCDKKEKVVWQSFEHPTDTILPEQILPTGSQLFSSVSEMDHSRGRFRLKMQDDGNLVSYHANTEDSPTDAYWSSETYFPNRGKLCLYLNSTGDFSIINSTSSELVKVINREKSLVNDIDNKTTIIYRATLDPNGIFRLYSHIVHDVNGKLQREVSIVWSALDNPCDVKGFCGLNSYCTLYDAEPDCVCLPGTEFVDPSRRTFGCLRNYFQLGCRAGKENVTFYNMTKMDNIRSEDTPYMETQMSMEECRMSCLEDCNCAAALFEQECTYGNCCGKQKLPLRYVRRDFGISTTAFFKVGKRKTKNNETHSIGAEGEKIVVTTKKALMQILALALGFIMFSCIALAISGFYIIKIRVLRYKTLRDDGTLGMNTTNYQELTLRVFSYNDLRRATNGFKEELGKGSFGAVYRGALNKGRQIVAVKRLEKLVEEGEREFKAEMRAIGRTNHKNLVRLLGYCAEGSKRVLVYEYMSNGSLADLLFSKNARIHLDWNERVRIAIDVARGILYLHEECKAPIIHCDIKPQNILMDDFWTAKISDFGLAKFLMPDQTRTFTGIRGTRGYLAPEWHKNDPISVKADVYSYGIVLLEVICCRKNLDVSVSNPEEMVLSKWVYKCFSARELSKLVVSEDQEDKKTLENMVKVGLWCIQDEPALRPSMKSVVLMLEGITEISIPPCPTSSSIM